MANFKGSLETLSLYLSRYNFFGSASFMCVKSGKFLQPNLLSNNSTFGLQSFLPYYAENSWKKLLPSGSNIIQCCCCCGKNPTLFLSSDNKKIRQMTSLQFLEEGGKREQVDEAAWYFFWRQKSSFCLADDLFLRSCYLRDGLISAAQSSSPRSKFAIVTKKRGPSSSSLGGKRST